MDSKCLRLVRICEVLFAQLCKGVYHTVQARAVVLLLSRGFTRTSEEIINNKPAFFMFAHNQSRVRCTNLRKI